MFNELAKLFSKEQKERRQFPRRKAKADLVWLDGTEQIPGTTIDMSQAGCMFITRQMPGTVEFDTLVDIGSRKIRLRMKRIRAGTVTRGTTQWIVIGCSYSGVAADEYDALVRYLKDIPEVENKLSKELAGIDKSDEDFRMLPSNIQQKIIGSLVRAGRLDIPPEGQQPLLRMEDQGSSSAGRRLAIHSRVITKDGPELYDTIVLIAPGGEIKIADAGQAQQSG